MINAGVASLDHWDDDWTAVTRDGKRSAQFEETILCVSRPASLRLCVLLKLTSTE
jgi:predicted NAD/FAD-dependent oxidoreductase